MFRNEQKAGWDIGFIVVENAKALYGGKQLNDSSNNDYVNTNCDKHISDICGNTMYIWQM